MEPLPLPTDTFFNKVRSLRQRCLKAFAAEEIQYLQLLNEILIKKDWWIKLNDPTITERWKHESGLPESTWMIMEQEIRHIESKLLVRLPHADNPAVKGTISPVSIPGVVISDSMISSVLHERLVELAVPLEKEALNKGSYHPGSDNKVLNLVHPSSYCLVYGRTKSSNTPNTFFGDSVIEFPESCSIPKYLYTQISTRFQWLPAEISVDSIGAVKFESYINNLHPHKYSKLTSVIELILQSALYMLSRSLASVYVEPYQRMDVDKYHPVYEKDEWVEIKYRQMNGIADDTPIDGDSEWKEYLRESWRHPDEFLRDRPMHFTPTLSDFKRPDAVIVDWNADMIAVDPKSNWGYPYKPNIHKYLTDEQLDDENMESLKPNVDPTLLEFPYRNRKLQVIVKLSNIHLTPEKPCYEGGQWHIEGMENEAIAATAIYYYDVVNITESRLTFRHELVENFNHQQDDFFHLEQLYGFKNFTTLPIQSFGSVPIHQGRLIAFPNYLQHKVEPFQLVDKTKPGHRKMIAFFLVHPEQRVMSTKHVPPQQQEWLRDLLAQALPPRVPSLVQHTIINMLDSHMTWAEAQSYAEELSHERKYFEGKAEKKLRPIHLCEH